MASRIVNGRRDRPGRRRAHSSDYRSRLLRRAAWPAGLPYNRVDEENREYEATGEQPSARCGRRRLLGHAGRFSALLGRSSEHRGARALVARAWKGRIAGTVASGFSFIPADGSPQLTLDADSIVHGNGPGQVRSAPSRCSASRSERSCGSRVRFGQSAHREFASPSPGGAEVVIARPGVQAVLQRPGVARVFVDNFETLDPSRWSGSGKVSIVEQPHASEGRSLRIPSGGASVLHNLEEPLSAGRLDLAFHDDGSVASGQKWSIDLTFQAPGGSSSLRVVPGWAEEGPGGRVSEVVRPWLSSDWPVPPAGHRFVLRFGPEQTEISVDGKELANGKGPEGPLTSIRLGSVAPALGAPALMRPKTRRATSTSCS